jgi:asparagine synthase (glutamine-hydrolysing)
MCGIAGIIYRDDIEEEDLPNGEKVLALLNHRGPDFRATKQIHNCIFYHSRLVIVDPSEASNQPYTDQGEHHALVYNGEIFNYGNLRQQFDGVHSNGDTEILFRLLQKYGAGCLNSLNGFFSFAFYDKEKRSLLLAKDRFGVKPLYYYKDEKKFAFASELKPLLEITGKQELNYEHLYTYFRLNFCAGRETIFKNIYRLLPGEKIDANGIHVTVEPWYHAKKEKLHGADLAELLDDAVKIRLNADVPVGAFLSGGLDSSIISALAIKHKPGLQTFSIGFAGEAHFDESHYSSLVAQHIKSNHHAIKLKQDDFLHHVTQFLTAVDEPFADSSAFNFYLLSQYTSKHVKVALSGDGADEIFKGYLRHKTQVLS